jgi:hypothetical protein
VGPDGAPSMMADGNTEKDAVKLMQNAIATPGAIRGNRIRQKVCVLVAPSIRDAFSRSGLMPEMYPSRRRNPMGKFWRKSDVTTPV